MIDRQILKSGFTMVEIMVVTVIIASIAVMLLPAVSKAKEKARYGRWIGQVATLRSDDGLVGLYNFEDGEGDVVKNSAVGSDVPEYDASQMDGNIVDGSICSWEEGRWRGKGGMLFVKSTPACIEIPTTKYMSIREGAVGVWARADKDQYGSLGYHGHLFDCNSRVNSSPAVSLLLGSSGELSVNMGYEVESAPGAVFEEGRFHLVIMTWSNGEYQVYFDGAQVIKRNYTYMDSDALPPVAGIGSVYGVDASGNGISDQGAWLGVIDEVFIYNRQLDPEDVNALYKMGL